MTTYYKITSTKETEYDGLGLGYEELYGDGPRYFRDRAAAQRRLAELNSLPYDEAGLCGTYAVEERQPGDDDDDDHYAEQMTH